MERLESLIGAERVRALDRAAASAGACAGEAMAAPAWAQARAAALLRRVPELDRKLVDRPASLTALARMLRGAGAGGAAVTPRPGRYLPSHTHGGAAELRALLAHARDPRVAAISLVPSSAGRSTPDLVIRRTPRAGGSTERVEVTALTRAPRGYAPRGAAARRALRAEDVAVRLLRKAARRQLTAPLSTPDLGVVPARGAIDVTLPAGPGARALARRAVAAAAPALVARAPHVARIVVRPGGGPALTYVRRGAAFVRVPR